VICDPNTDYDFSYLPAIISTIVVCIPMDQNPQTARIDNFFQSEYQKLLNFVRKNLEERFFGASPEDIVQDVALGLINRLDLDTQVGNLSAYIYRSIKNRIIDSQKKPQRNVSIEDFGDQEKGNYLLNTISNETDEETAYRDIDPVRLKEAIGQLRPDEQAVIIATEFEERSYEDLSDEWEVPVGTLLSRKHRALSKLHKILLNQNNNNHGNN
jgi:RNA polymerase sigma-70 factor (ECF subfamily)